MTREGPNSRRPELRMAAVDDKARVIQAATYDLFEQPDFEKIGNRKQKIFFLTAWLEEYVLEHFHPLFEPLKGLVRELYGLLVAAYQKRQFDYLHDKFLQSLRGAAETVKDWKPGDAYTVQLMEKEKKRRNDELASWDGGGGGWDQSPNVQRTVAASGTTPPTTPSTSGFPAPVGNPRTPTKNTVPDPPSAQLRIPTQDDSPTSEAVARQAKRARPNP
jgi:hypothetical protein